MCVFQIYFQCIVLIHCIGCRFMFVQGLLCAFHPVWLHLVRNKVYNTPLPAHTAPLFFSAQCPKFTPMYKSKFCFRSSISMPHVIVSVRTRGTHAVSVTQVWVITIIISYLFKSGKASVTLSHSSNAYFDPQKYKPQIRIILR